MWKPLNRFFNKKYSGSLPWATKSHRPKKPWSHRNLISWDAIFTFLFYEPTLKKINDILFCFSLNDNISNIIGVH